MTLAQIVELKIYKNTLKYDKLGFAIYPKPCRAKVNKFYRYDAKSDEIIYHYFTIAQAA